MVISSCSGLMSERYAAAIAALTGLQGWLGEYPDLYLDGAIARLRGPELTPEDKAELRHLLSQKMLFHIKWLGDRYIKEFPVGGAPNPHWAWLDYLDNVMNICQEALK